jgi:hypothetical protein
MTTTYRFILCAAGVVTAAGALAADRPVPAATGHVLVLESERTVEGDIERVGNQYRVHRAVGETWMPCDKVLRLCADMDEAYLFLRGRANVNDPDELLRLARWCHGHALPARALECASGAVKLSPNHPEANRLLNALKRVAPAAPAAPKSHPETAEAAEVPELNTEARAAFATKVEPILINACAGCHTSGHGGSFKLMRGYDSTSINRVSVQQNLAAVLAQVNLQQPQESKLLVKAVTAHDPQSREAPLNKKQMAAYHTLEDWVQTTLANNPHLRDRAPQATAAPPAEPKTVTTAAPQPKPAAPPAETVPAAPAPGGFAAARPAPAKPTTPVDEFDPALFNRQSEPSAEKK